MAFTPTQTNNIDTQNAQGRRVRGAWVEPDYITVTVTSNAGEGALNTLVKVFNNDGNNAAQDALVTTNGSAANSITYSFGDGKNGKSYAELFRRGQGVLVDQILVTMTDASGNQITSPLPTLGLKLMSDDCQGGKVPMPIGIESGFDPKNSQSGMLILNTQAVINPLEQFTFTMIPASKISLSLRVVKRG